MQQVFNYFTSNPAEWDGYLLFNLVDFSPTHDSHLSELQRDKAKIGELIIKR